MEKGDLERVLQIQQACYAPSFHEPISAFSSKLAACPYSCWVACNGFNIYAYLVSLPIDPNNLPALHASNWCQGERPTLLYLHDLAIDPASRGQGHSRALLAAAQAYARDQQLRRIGLIAVQDSQAFWHTQGFKPELALGLQAQEKLASFGHDAIYMERALP